MANCAGCFGRCCSAHNISISGHGAYELARGQNLVMAQFVMFTGETTPTDIGVRFDGAPTYRMMLRRRESGACYFLMRFESGVARCGTYASRPAPCRNYPVDLLHGAVQVREKNMCEPVGTPTITSLDLGPERLDIGRTFHEWAIYRHVVHAWNTYVDEIGGSNPETFLVYLDAEYSRIAAMSAQLSQAEIEALYRARTKRDVSGRVLAGADMQAQFDRLLSVVAGPATLLASA